MYIHAGGALALAPGYNIVLYSTGIRKLTVAFGEIINNETYKILHKCASSGGDTSAPLVHILNIYLLALALEKRVSLLVRGISL
jgi:hypothetical protein